MSQYEIVIEAADDADILEKNYSELIISLINACIGEENKNEKSNYLFEGFDGGSS